MEKRVNLQHITELFIKEQGIESGKAEAFSNAFFALIEEGLEKDKYVKIKGLGSFKLITVDNRESINVNTGERIEIPSYTKVSFTPENTLKERINKPFAHFETVVLNENVTFEEDTTKEEEDVKEEENVKEVEEKKEIEVEKETKAEKETVEEELQTPAPTPKVETKAEVKKEPETPSKKNPFLSILIIAILLLCVGVALYFSFPDLFRNSFAEEETPQQVEIQAPETEEPTIAVNDTVEYKNETTDLEAKEIKEEKTEQPAEPATKPEVSRKLTPVNPDSTNYNITGTRTTYTLQEGETLIRVSLQFYNTKDLWPYILKHNLDVIKNPDVVPAGTVLKIPELQKK